MNEGPPEIPDAEATRWLRLVLGVACFAAIPALAGAGLVELVAAVGAPVDRTIGAITGVLLIGVVVAAGEPLADRIASSLSVDEPDEAMAERVDRLADELGVAPPEVRMVEAGATNVALFGRSPGSATLLVSERLVDVADESSVDATIVAALTRVNRDGPLTTALLPATLVVETLVLLGIDLVRSWDEDDEDDTRAAFGERPGRDLSGVTAIAGAVGGGLLLVAIAPFWLLLVLGDRLLVGGGRREADRVAGAVGHGNALADHLTDATDVTSYADWPPALDRLSIVPLADETIRSLRGTARGEVRVREARLRTGRE